MEFKTLEIRDEGRHIAALAIKLKAETAMQEYAIHYRAGHSYTDPSIVLMKLDGCNATANCHDWTHEPLNSPRTMYNAHSYIEKHFDELKDGDVVDVSFILGERKEPRKTERPDNWRAAMQIFEPEGQ